MNAQVSTSPSVAESRHRPQVRVVPVSFAQACAFVDNVHRHHARPQGHKFSAGALDETSTRVGVAIIGRLAARSFDDGWTLEVTRLATTDGSPNACSALYGAAWRTARAQGYRRLITYTQVGESGASLRAAGFRQTGTRTARPGLFVVDRALNFDLAAGLAFNAITHWWADRRHALAWLATVLPGDTGVFYRLGAPRPGHDDNHSIGTGAYALDLLCTSSVVRGAR